MKKIALFILLNFVFTACDFDRNTGMNVFNKSKTVIYTFVSCSDSLKDIDYTFFYSVYTYGKNRQDTVYLNNRIQQDSVSNIVFTYELKPIFQNCKDPKLRIFFIRESILKERTWDEICHEKLYEKLTVTEEELKKNNWTVIYEGHSSITDESGNTLVSVGPDSPVQKAASISETWRNSIKGADVGWETYLGKQGTWTTELNNISTTAISKYASGITRWNLLLNSCIGHTSRALWSAGVPNIYLFHPHVLNAQLLIRQLGIYASPYLYQIP